MDVTPALKSDVFRPLVSNLVPGGVAITPYALLLGYRFDGVESLAVSYPVAAGLLALFAALAVGLILENLGLMLEAHVWDPLCQEDTGVQYSDWWRYLTLSANTEQVGHRYLRQLVTRLKFETSFGFSLIVFWVGLLWLDIHVPIIGSFGRLLLVSFGILGLAAYLLWESGVTGRGLADVRHVLLYGTKCPTERDREPRADSFDRQLVGLGVAMLLVGIGATSYLLNQVIARGGWTGLTAAAFFTFGGFVCIVTRYRGDRDGRRSSNAFRLGLAYALLAVVFTLRLVDRGHNLWGWLSLAACVAASAFLFWMSRRVVVALPPQADAPATDMPSNVALQQTGLQSRSEAAGK